MASALTLANLLDWLDGGMLLLPTARAARELRASFDARRRALGLTAWEPAPALFWQQWTSSLWSELVVAGVETRLLLNAAQEHSLWREIVVDDTAHRTLGSPDSLAELAHTAWALAARYNTTARLPPSPSTAGLRHDSRIFSQWAAEFTRRCMERNLLSADLLDDALRLHVERGMLPAPTALELVGFADLTLAQQGLLTALRERGAAIAMHYLAAAPDAQPLRASITAADPREELQWAARWVRRYLEDHRESHPRVAILVPNLAEERAELDSVFRDVLAPELQSIATDLSSSPWEISAAAPLASLAMISAALGLAQWTRGPLSLDRIGTLLLSPYLGDPSQRDALACFDANTLRRQTLLRPQIDMAHVLRLLSPREPDTPALAEWLRDVQSLAQRAASIRAATFAEWMEHMRALLAAAQWPSAESQALTAAEFEATRAWDGVLDLVSTLDFSGRRVPFDAALEALQFHAQRTACASPTLRAPVQVMRVAEAEGCLFDAVVFLRATDANWPAPERANPLLPWPLQRSLAMPGTDAARTTQRAREVTAALLARSGTVLFTSAAADNEGQLRPAPLLTEFGVAQLSPEQLCPAPPPSPHIEPETFADDAPLPPLTTTQVRGGAAVLQAQAACGFRAFAEFRLFASGLESRDLGFDARDIGSRVHLALESFWREMKSQQRLLHATPEETDEILRLAVNTALQHNLTPRGDWDHTYLDLQRRRLHKLLKDWLEMERVRGPFQVIDSEHKVILPIGPLDLRLRLDRMDRIGVDDEGEDEVVLVDYKTGASAHPNLWQGNRPDEPQLPLYALHPPSGSVKAIAFAKVRPGKQMKWSGYEAEPGILPKARGNAADLNQLIADWRVTLTQLAQDFADGKAFVDPKAYPDTCDRCGQRLLCRLDPATLREQDNEESVEEPDG